jgi:hypothetical protein
MIQITEVIRYLRDNIESFKVGGAAELAAAKDDSRLMVESGTVIPTLFAMLGNYVALEDNENAQTPQQDTDQRLVIIACLNNSADRTGQHAQQLVPSVRRALLRLLYNNNQFDTDAHPLQYVGDAMSEMDRARYWHRFEFRCKGRINITDGKEFDLDNFDRMVNTWIKTGYTDNPLAVDDIKNLYDGAPD